MISISAAERQARIAVRQHLAPEYRVDSMAEAARGVVGLHATDPASVYLSAWARMRQPSIDAIERELYEERRLIRILAMRRTLFVVPTDDAPILQAAASLGVARIERRRNEQLAGLLGVDDPDGFMRRPKRRPWLPWKSAARPPPRSSPELCRRSHARCASTSASATRATSASPAGSSSC